MVSLRCLALAWVIWPVEKSNTSSLHPTMQVIYSQIYPLRKLHDMDALHKLKVSLHVHDYTSRDDYTKYHLLHNSVWSCALGVGVKTARGGVRKTAHLSSLRMIMLLVHSDSEVLLAPTISDMNVGQFLGHSCFTICMERKKGKLTLTKLYREFISITRDWRERDWQRSGSRDASTLKST